MKMRDQQAKARMRETKAKMEEGQTPTKEIGFGPHSVSSVQKANLISAADSRTDGLPSQD